MIGGAVFGCDSISTIILVVKDLDTATVMFQKEVYCIDDQNPFPLIEGKQKGFFAISNEGVIDPTSGEIDILTSGLGNYQISFTTSGFCPTIATFDLRINNASTNAGQDKTIHIGDQVSLQAIKQIGSYTWSPPDWLSCLVCNPTTATPDEDIIYTVTYVDSNGCIATDDVAIFVSKDHGLFVPNAFTPNGNNTNETFFPIGQGISEKNYEFSIYDQWGEQIFRSTNPQTNQSLNGPGWDGRYEGELVQQGVYVWKLTYRDDNGLDQNHVGRVSLLR